MAELHLTPEGKIDTEYYLRPALTGLINESVKRIEDLDPIIAMRIGMSLVLQCAVLMIQTGNDSGMQKCHEFVTFLDKKQEKDAKNI